MPRGKVLLLADYRGCTSARKGSRTHQGRRGPDPPVAGRGEHSIVNYDSFVVDPDILDKYVDERYYLSVSRYSTSGFLRLTLGAELRKRRLSSHVFETRREARRHLGTR